MSAITWHDYVCVSFVEIGIADLADVTIRQSYRLIYLCAAERFPTDFKVTTPVDKLSNIWFLSPFPYFWCLDVIYLNNDSLGG